MSAATTIHSMALDVLLDGFARDIPSRVPVSGLAMDSRAVEPGDVFIAVKGTRLHGLNHLAQAVERGASAILWEPALGLNAPDIELPCVAIDQLGRKLGEIAARFFAFPADRMFVAGVTGTDGKTSTAHLIAQAFETLGQRCAYLGTLGSGRLDALEVSSHTTPNPITLQRRLSTFVEDGIQSCAMEVSSHALDQNRIGGIRFDAVLLTNLSRDHLDYHGTVDNYSAAKKQLFLPQDGRRLILNRDDEYGARWISEFQSDPEKCRMLMVYGLADERPEQRDFVMGRKLELSAEGLSLNLHTATEVCELKSGLIGIFNAYNLLAAAAVLIASGVKLREAASALSQCKTVPGRCEAFRAATGGPLTVVDYAHTPRALEQALRAVRAHTDGKLICVFGCGGERDRGKRALMGRSASLLAEELILTDDNPRSESPQAIVAEILQGIGESDRSRVRIEHDRAKAIAEALSAAGPGDTILIAGKGHETTQTVGSEIRPFSDRACVSNLLGALVS